MFDLDTKLFNFTEFLIERVAECDFTLNVICIVCTFVVQISLEYLRSLLSNFSTISIEERLRNATHSLTLSGMNIEPRRITIIHVTDSIYLDNVLNDLLSSVDWFPVLGMDAEMKQRPGKAPRIQMVQFANRLGDCILVRFPLRVSNFPRVFIDIVSDPYIWKVGVGVYDDLHNLSKNHPQNDLIPQGTFDLRYLAHDAGLSERGLKKLAHKLLGIETYDKRLGTEHWDSPELTNSQIKYAAMDAYLGIVLFEKFFEMHLLKKFDLTIRITEEIKKEELSNFLHKWFDKKSRQFHNDFAVTDKIMYFCDWLIKLIMHQM